MSFEIIFWIAFAAMIVAAMLSLGLTIGFLIFKARNARQNLQVDDRLNSAFSHSGQDISQQKGTNLKDKNTSKTPFAHNQESESSRSHAMELADVKKRLSEAEDRLEAQAEILNAYFIEARTDLLTGLPNRRGIEQIAESEINKGVSNKNPLIVAIVDVDRFKSINDQYGHAAGDATLRHVARFLQTSMPSNTSVARYGGEEFVILLRASLQQAATNLEEVKNSIADNHLRFDQQIISFTVSIGVSEIEPGQQLALAMKNADQALYRAKRGGKNCLVTY